MSESPSLLNHCIHFWITKHPVQVSERLLKAVQTIWKRRWGTVKRLRAVFLLDAERTCGFRRGHRSTATWGALRCSHPTKDNRGQGIVPRLVFRSPRPLAGYHRPKAHLGQESTTLEGGPVPPLPYRKSYGRLEETLPQVPEFTPHRV